MRFWPVFVVLLVACEASSGEPQIPVAGKDFRIELSQPKAVTAGSPTTCELTVTPSGPWKLKAETPFSATLTPGPGLKVEKAKLDNKDFVDATAPAKAVRTGCTAEGSGNKTLKASLTFFLCSAEICKRMQEQLTASLKTN